MLRPLLREFVLKLVISVMIAATLAIWAVLTKIWSIPTAIVGGVLLACGLIFLMDRFGIGDMSINEKIRNWLDDSGYAIKKVDDDNNFHYRVTDNIGMITDVIRHKSDSPILIATGRHTASPKQLAHYNALAPADQDAFWRAVRLELLRYGISFSDLKLDEDGVAFSHQIVPSALLTSTEFLSKLRFVRSAGRLYWELLLGLNPPAATTPASSPASAPTPPAGNQRDPDELGSTRPAS